jgi:hypothetical protein
VRLPLGGHAIAAGLADSHQSITRFKMGE